MDEKRAAQCSGKVRFFSADIAAKAARRKSGRVVYHCRHCGGWHVGDTRNKRRGGGAGPKVRSPGERRSFRALQARAKALAGEE